MINGHNSTGVKLSVREAQAERARLSLIACRTRIGLGSPNQHPSNKVHREPPDAEKVRLTKERWDWPPDSQFCIPGAARALMRESGARGAARQTEWSSLLIGYAATCPDLAAELRQIIEGELPSDGDATLLLAVEKPIPTHAAWGAVLDAMAARRIAGRRRTLPKDEESLTRDDCSGRCLRLDVRKHGRGSTFLVFADSIPPAIRRAESRELPVIFVFTHEGLGLGANGPTTRPASL